MRAMLAIVRSAALVSIDAYDVIVEVDPMERRDTQAGY
jgi:hypothetical protein